MRTAFCVLQRIFELSVRLFLLTAEVLGQRESVESGLGWLGGAPLCYVHFLTFGDNSQFLVE